MNRRLPLVFILIFLVVAAVINLILGRQPGFDLPALYAADVLMLLLSLAAWAMLKTNVDSRPQAFVRGVYGATMLRLFVCLVGILSYALLKKPVHKPTLFVMFGIYAVYTVVETMAFSRHARRVS